MDNMLLIDISRLRRQALAGGAVDPAILRFRLTEYNAHTGVLIGVVESDIGLTAALCLVQALISSHDQSRFLLQPIGFVQ